MSELAPIEKNVKISHKVVEQFKDQTIASSLVSQTIPLKDLAPGSYALKLSLTDRVSHKDLHDTVSLVIE